MKKKCVVGVLILSLVVLVFASGCNLCTLANALMPPVTPIATPERGLPLPTKPMVFNTPTAPAGAQPISQDTPTPAATPTPEVVNWVVFKTPNQQYQIAIDQRILEAVGGEVDLAAWEKALEKVASSAWYQRKEDDSSTPFESKELFLRIYRQGSGKNIGGRIINSTSIYLSENGEVGERNEFLHQFVGNHQKYWGLAVYDCMVVDEEPCHPWPTALEWLILNEIANQWQETWPQGAGGQDLSPAVEAGKFLQAYHLFPRVDYGSEKWWDWGTKYQCSIKEDAYSMKEPIEDGKEGNVDYDEGRRENELKAGEQVECYIVPGIIWASGFEKVDPFCMRVQERDFISFVHLEGSCLAIE